ncbi:cell envelope integrity protein TolA [Methylocella silvestris]|uniref:Bacteriophage tail tape measure C-terminal domain-containing protein n=1 Tax=Methylocella silvestris TaxID=199596 RepID=A0A2J7TJQ6_METSI|nr:cell envelope integrity protein TolA [Methylocella silvestris]PNG27001.1 hypothetical protein CR492_04675 [Methylocella silvestris]
MAGQPLVLKFSTDLSQAQRGLTEFAKNAAVNLLSIADKAIEAKKQLDFLNSFSGKIAVGVIGFIGFEAIRGSINLLNSAATEAEASLARLVKIGTDSQGAGVSASFFQSWTGQAKALNVETSTLVGMLDRARAAATQTIGDKGGTSSSPGADRIKQNVLAGNLGSSALSSYNGAGDQEARIRIVLGLIEQLRQKGDQLAAFDLGKTFFGDQFEAQLRNGVDMIGQMRTALDGLQTAGGERIIPQAEIANATRMKAELDDINDRLSKASEPFLRDIAAWQQGILGDVIQLKSAWADIVGVLGTAWDWMSKIGSLMPSMSLGPRVGNGLFGAQGGLTSGQLMDLIEKGGSIGTEVFGPDQPASLPAITVRGDRSKALPSLTPAKLAAPAEKTDQVETYINSLKKQTAAEEAEAKTLGLGNKAREEAVDLAKAQEAAKIRGTPLTAAEAEKVKQLADAYVDAKKQIDDYARAQENAKATAEFFGQSLESAIEKAIEPGAKLQDVLKGVVQSLEQASLKALILGEGPLASLFGTAASPDAKGADSVGGIFGQIVKGFSGFHAAGGTIPAGGWGIAGEAGAEIINGPATVTPMKQINAALNAGGSRGGAAVDNRRSFHIDARGAQAGVSDQIVAALKSYDAQLNRSLPTRVAAAHGRYA